MHQHGLNAVLQCNSARVTGPAGSSQLQIDHAIFKAAEFDITSVLLDRRSDSGLQKLLNHADDFVILLVIAQRILAPTLLATFCRCPLNCVYNVLSGCHSLGDQAENLGFNVSPVGITRFGNGNEVRSVKYR